MKVDYTTPIYSDVGAPIIDIVISDPLEMQSKSVQALIDTGYDGELIIPLSTFEELGLYAFELSKDQFSIAETASGERIMLVSANGFISIDNMELDVEVIIDTHKTCQEVILGRSFLEDFDLSLYGKDQSLDLNLS